MSTPEIRRPAVAGLFYPGRPDALAALLGTMLSSSDGEGADTGDASPKMLIVPHAGYVYSGAIAAAAYRRLRAVRSRVTRVVLLGPAHREPVHGLALPAARAFATPLGAVPVDAALSQRVRGFPQVCVSDSAHALEHALEVQLPFLQAVLDRFAVLPLVVGDATPDEVAEVLEAVWGGPETLILISSDLSHYLSDARARASDARAVEAILALDPRLDHRQACGAAPINGALKAATRRGLAPTLLAMRNSGEVSGDLDRVVGYCAIAFAESADA